MEKLLIYPAGSTKACQYAASRLEKAGLGIVDHPTPEVTHLLLDVPGFGPDGTLRGGGDITELLRMLPHTISIIGGNLNHPSLKNHRTVDLLQDAQYLAQNAAITAECALQVADSNLEIVFSGAPVLIIGWGRIGKCLGQLLRSLSADVTIAARKETDRAMLHGLGYQAVDMECLPRILPKFRVIFNTAPEIVIPRSLSDICKKCLFIDLASKPGIDAEDVIQARGLPGIYAPESSGQLIADTILRRFRRHKED